MTNQLPEFAPRSFNGIVRTVATVDVEGIGAVHFERPSLYHMGQKRWHIDFSFDAEGKRYWGTVWNRTREVELRGCYYKRGIANARLVPESAKTQWREAIRRAAYPFIDAACAAYVEAVESGDDKRAERVAMGMDIPAKPEQLDSGLIDPMGELRGTGILVPEPEQPATVQYIDCTPTWAQAASIIALALENGTGEGKRMAREELQRMAALLDSYMAEKRRALAVIYGDNSPTLPSPNVER